MKALADAHLDTQVLQLLTELQDIVKVHLPEAQLILFGSVARGDNDHESDHDIFVITREEVSHREQHKIIEDVLPLELERDAVISLVFCSQDRWDVEQRRPLHREIQRDGILLLNPDDTRSI